jgi:hypothetical protein
MECAQTIEWRVRQGKTPSWLAGITIGFGLAEFERTCGGCGGVAEFDGVGPVIETCGMSESPGRLEGRDRVRGTVIPPL